MDTKITSAIWANLEFDAIPPDGKLAAFWLLTNEAVNVVGYAEFNERRFKFETQLDAEALQRAYQGLGKGLVKVGKGYWLRNYIGYQYGRGPSLSDNNWAKGICKYLQGAAPHELVRLVLGEYPELKNVKGFISPSKGFRTSGSTREERIGEERSREEQRGEDILLASIWDAYPKKVAKEAGLKAMRKVIAEGRITPENLLQKVRAYAEATKLWPDAKRQFIPHPATWFNDGRYEDDPAAWSAEQFSASDRRPGVSLKNSLQSVDRSFDPTKANAHTGGLPGV